MSIKVSTNKAPKAVGPYSQAIIAGDSMYISGQLPINPETQELIDGDIVKQTIQIINNLVEILKEGDFKISDVVMTQIYMTDLSQFSDMNNAYSEFFDEIMPARVTVGVSSLPKGSEIEISLVAKKS